MKKFSFLIAALIMNAFASVDSFAQTEIIMEQPEGTLKTYYRAGYNYYNNGGYVTRGTQVGNVDIVYADNNEVYIKDPLSKALTGAWVKATINEDGTEITLPLEQPIFYDAELKDTVVIRMINYDDSWEEFYPNEDNIESLTFKVDGETLSLQGTSRYQVLGAVWKSSGAWAEHADYDTKYSIKDAEDELVTVPEDLVSEAYKMSAFSYVYEKEMTYNVEIGVDGNDMYIKGIFKDTPNAWIKGTIDGNKVTFPKLQFLGYITGGNLNSYYMLATPYGNTQVMEDLVLTYNEETGEYTTDQNLVLNTSRVSIYFTEALSSVKIYEAKVAGSYDIPYTESFDGGIDEFYVIDANEDANTWKYNSLSGVVAYDTYTNDADDWFITPALKLEAGKEYTFSIDAKCFSSVWPERFEVKCGTAATAEAMTSTVIEAVSVDNSDFETYKGTFAPAESGNYYFGVHAISVVADAFTLTVDNVSVVSQESVNIENVADDADVPSDVYTLDGRLVKKNALSTEGLEKGIYIFKNKKVVVK